MVTKGELLSDGFYVRSSYVFYVSFPDKTRGV